MDGHDAGAVLQRFEEDGLLGDTDQDEQFDGGDQLFDTADQISPERLVKLDLSDVGWIPASFGCLMALTALAALSYVVASSARARRGELATLRALGLSPGKPAPRSPG